MLKRFLFGILFFLVSSISCPAQNIDIDNRLLSLSSAERIRYMNGYMEESNLVNSNKFDLFLEQLKDFAKLHNDQLLLSHVEYNIKGKPIFYEKNVQKKINLIRELQLYSEKKNDLFHVGDCLVAIGQVQFGNGQYADAFENLLAADEIFKKIGYRNVPMMGKYLHDFALDYFFFQDYEKTIKYMKESIKLPKYNDNLDIQRYNTLGSSYLKLNQLDNAYYYFNIAYKKAKIYKDITWLGIIAGNIGEVLYKKGEYQKALKHFQEVEQINRENNFSDAQHSTALNLTKTYLELGDSRKASEYLLLARKYFPKPQTSIFGNQQVLEQQKRYYYEVSRQYHLASRDYKTAILYADSLHTSEKALDRKYNALVVGKAADQLQLLQSKMTLQIHEKEQRIKNIIIISLIIISVLGAGVTFFISKYKKKLNYQKQLLLSSKLEITEQNLKLSELKLDGFKKRIQEKRQLIENMQEQLASATNVNNDIIFQLQQSTILTEEDWQNFKILFEQVHSGFLTQLKEKYPQLSPAEIRFLSLAKLNFSRKEMSSALGVSTQSIHTNWYRIRKKLDLSESATVEELIETI